MSSSPSSSSSSELPPPAEGPLAWVLDVPCPVEFVLGTATVKVRECVDFGVDTVLRLTQTAGSDLQVRVGGVPIASGEIVIVDENLAMRLSRILPPGSGDPA
jgi:flagellar motor switch protein FliN/FliY